MLNFKQIYLSFLFGFVILPLSIFAQEKNPQGKQIAQGSAESKNAKEKSGPKVIEFNQLSLEGKIRRPSASYLLQRKKLKFKGLEPKKSFIPQILQSVKKSPF
jgi:hypothetical protein